MVKMEALEKFSYDGKDLEPGDPFIASELEHARLLSIVGRAKVADEDSAGTSPGEQKKPVTRGRQYNRRDLTAQE